MLIGVEEVSRLPGVDVEAVSRVPSVDVEAMSRVPSVDVEAVSRVPSVDVDLCGKVRPHTRFKEDRLGSCAMPTNRLVFLHLHCTAK
jgi:hypothetical protein